MRRDKRFHDGKRDIAVFRTLVSSTFDKLSRWIRICTAIRRSPRSTRSHHHPACRAPLLGRLDREACRKPLIVGPDEESEQWAGSIASRIGAPHVVLRKTRHGDRSVDIDVPDLSVWRDRTPVLVDDIASSGRTLAVAAHQARRTRNAQAGVRGGACPVRRRCLDQLTPLFARITSTDAVPHPSNRIGLGFADCRRAFQREDRSANLIFHRSRYFQGTRNALSG